jgi:hypothetical protein
VPPDHAVHEPRPAAPAPAAAGPHDPVSATSPASQPPSVPAAAADRVPSTAPQVVNNSAVREPVAPGGAPVEPAPAAAQASQPAPSFTSSAPHSLPAAGHPPELPGGGWHGHGDGGAPGGHPHGHLPHDHGPNGPGRGGPHDDRPHGTSDDGAGPSGLGAGEPRDPVHSHEPSGDGWHRLEDKPVDPHYGQPLDDHWDYPYDPTDSRAVEPEVRELMTDAEAPFGRSKNGHPYSQAEYAERFNKVGPDGQHWYNFPGNSGAVPGTRVAYSNLGAFVRDYGSLLDRIGDEEGTYLAVMENGQPASWEQRALHVSSLREPYGAYTLSHLPEKWSIEVSEVAPGLGQPGGSLQVRIFDAQGEPRRVEDLIGGVLTQ